MQSHHASFFREGIQQAGLGWIKLGRAIVICTFTTITTLNTITRRGPGRSLFPRFLPILGTYNRDRDHMNDYLSTK